MSKCLISSTPSHSGDGRRCFPRRGGHPPWRSGESKRVGRLAAPAGGTRPDGGGGAWALGGGAGPACEGESGGGGGAHQHGRPPHLCWASRLPPLPPAGWPRGSAAVGAGGSGERRGGGTPTGRLWAGAALDPWSEGEGSCGAWACGWGRAGVAGGPACQWRRRAGTRRRCVSAAATLLCASSAAPAVGPSQRDAPPVLAAARTDQCPGTPRQRLTAASTGCRAHTTHIGKRPHPRPTPHGQLAGQRRNADAVPVRVTGSQRLERRGPQHARPLGQLQAAAPLDL